MSLGRNPRIEFRRFNRLITIEWLMKILWELYDFNDRNLQLTIKRCSVLGDVTWDEVKKHPAQVVCVLMAFMKLLAKRDSVLEEIVEIYVNNNIYEAFGKADKYFERLKKISENNDFIRGVDLV